MVKRLFLPVGLSLALLIAFIYPSPGTFFREAGVVKALIITIFVVNGYRSEFKLRHLTGGLLKAVGWGALSCLIAAPVLALAVAKILHLEASLTVGLIVMAAVAPTLSSGIVITETAGGDTLWAILLTISLNLLGIITAPFAISICLAVNGDTSIDAVMLFLKIAQLVLLPFFVGVIVAVCLPRYKHSYPLAYVPSVCVILTVWAAASAGNSVIRVLEVTDLYRITGAVIIVHGILLLINAGGGALLKLPSGGRKALLFVASQKTLPIALSILISLDYSVTSALAVCVLFHFIQLLIDSLLAAKVNHAITD